MTLKEILTSDHVNSRLIFLFTSATVCLCVLGLTVAFMLAKTQTYYPDMIGILLAGGLGGAAGRWLTGRNAQPESSSSSSSTTTTTENKVGQ